MNAEALSRGFCLVVGLPLVLDGLLGVIFAGTDLTVSDNLPHREWNFFFEFNEAHQLLHVATGAMLVVAAAKRAWAPVGALVFGLIYAVTAPVGFIDGNDIVDVIYSDTPDNWVHAVLAVVGIWLGIAGGAIRPSRRRPRRSGE